MLSRATIARWYQAVQGYRADPTIPNVPLAKYITPATRASSPLAIYGEGLADRPGVRSHSHSQKFSHLPQADVYFPISIYGEGGRG